MGKKSSSPPPQPDYTKAAEAQAQSNREAINMQTWANRPNVNTPWGSETWQSNATVDPATGQKVTQWTQNTTLPPELEAALQDQLGMQRDRSDLAGDFTQRVRDSYANEFDWAGMPEMSRDSGAATTDAYNRMSALLQPERDQSRQEFETSLVNRGVARGSQAWNNELRQYSDMEARQDQQNMLAAMGEGRSQGSWQNQVRQQAIAEEAQKRGMSLNEMNALLTGQQVNMPQMPGFQAAGNAGGTNYMGAAGQQYQGGLDAFNINQQQAQAQGQGTMSAVAGVAGIAAMAF